MSITVDMLLQLPIMKEYSTIICGSGYTNEVQYVTVAEASSINFSNLGDKIFVLTTLSNYHDSLEETNCFIRGLCQAGISAIGIKLGRFVNEIDSSTIAIAEQYHVVLLSISPHAYFREILSETLSLITGNQRHTLSQINTVNQSLIRAIMHNRSIQDLLDILCQHLDCYCCCFDPTGKKFAETSSLSLQILIPIPFIAPLKHFLFSPISSGILIFRKTTFSFSRAWSTTKCLPHCALLSLSNLWMS